MQPRGAMMVGMSRTTSGDATEGYEHLAIREDSGKVIFQARPSGQDAAEFRMQAQSDSSVRFANPAHDFPKWIQYESRAGGDSLVARIGGVKEQTMEFPYARASCPSRE